MRAIFAIIAFSTLSIALAAQCSVRGGCTCDCSWANPSTCLIDDGSCCFACCCGGSSPTSAPPTPSPTPSGNVTAYCPSASDFVVAYGSSVSLFNRGWAVAGGGAAATRAAFDLLGGSVEYDVDFSGVPTGVNANVYTISPRFSGSFSQGNYCDGQGGGTGWCMEVDWIETNGNCGGQTTLHTKAGPGTVGCTAWGCEANYLYSGRSTFHMKVSFAEDGTWTTTRDGQTISPASMSPSPLQSDWDTLRQTSSSQGAVIYSSQWTGWVPRSDCGSSGDLLSAKFSVTNLVVRGRVVQGPEPTHC